ncbi:MAG: pyruvate:ferredoxin (flavodoxin) oxidoreductase [Planctomycetota bacterium]|jgi:pyruvate-ferredoxin/flavodoxin oxidoreductase|nr:pyruvate:ferredoxin (flavodoxin) oxidoreductase [Planctomycetota bacterium]
MAGRKEPFDGNQAAAEVAHAVNEVCAIYPITPSSTLGEICDAKSAAGETNIWGSIPLISEMQSEAGAAGAVHGSLSVGALTSTFTASQGLLLMIPNMYKIAGELTPTTFYVTARTVATHALSIFGDHSDVMACRQTGFAMMVAANVQETHDLALICQAATLKSRVPFLSFYDGFRTSHEIQKIEVLSKEDMRKMIDDGLVREFRARALSPDHPSIRGTAQNPDVFFQSREACNPWYDKCADIVQDEMDKFAGLFGRQYRLFDYYGAPDADRAIVIMGSGADAAKESVDWLNAKGDKVGMISVHLYRPFSIKSFLAALPTASLKGVAVLDRTKEPGAPGEPLYEDVRTAFGEAMQTDGKLFGGRWPKVIGGRYGLSCKEFTPAMANAIFAELRKEEPKNHFTIGITDDVGHTSIPYEEGLDLEADNVRRCIFYGLGSDGTVGANKNSIKIIADHTDNYAQGYFVYDSKKAGAITASHLRFGPQPIKSTYLVHSANFIACHQWSFLEKYDMLKDLKEGGVFLLNSIYGKDEVWDRLPREVQRRIIEKKAGFYVIDAYEVAKKTGMGVMINTIMQTCFFKIAGVIPADEAIGHIKSAIKKTYSKKGEAVVKKNNDAVDQAIAHLFQVDYSNRKADGKPKPAIVAEEAPRFVLDTLAKIMVNDGESLPVSKLPIDGVFPTSTTQWEKRNIALSIPVWEADLCIQCAKCSIVCPHAVIRMKIYDSKHAEEAPPTFKKAPARGPSVKDLSCTVQVFPEDCTGCGACVAACPVKDKQDPARKAINMRPQPPIRESERENARFFLEKIPDTPDGLFPLVTVKGSQLRRPLFEFSGACAGCGETPYVKLITQLFGDRMLAGNATGCSSIYGGNLPTTPYCVNRDGRGPSWSNSLFEDNAEFGFGMRLAADKFQGQAGEFLRTLARDGSLKDRADLVKNILEAKQADQADIDSQRERVAEVKKILAGDASDTARNFLAIADYLVKKSIWIIGGDGWAYDIGYGGLDHVLASDKNVNVLVLDTEVYSNTGGQASKSTPLGAVARFAESGKNTGKKDLGMIAMTYGTIYVAKVAIGYSDAQVVKALLEAENYDGPSLIIAYAHCIAHGIRGMADGLGLGFAEQKKAVESGHFPLYRFDPRLAREGRNPLQLDSKPPSLAYKDWAMGENRFQVLAKKDPAVAEKFAEQAAREEGLRWRIYEQMAKMSFEK